MKIVIDTEACKKKGYELDVLFYLFSHYAGCPVTVDTFERARQQGLLKFERPYDRAVPFPKYVSLSKTGDYMVDTVIGFSNSKKNMPDEHLKELADKLREIFPSGKKPGYSDTWRDSTSCIAERLQKFFFKYGHFEDDDIIKATKEYVSSFNGDYRYMQLLKYFIWKNKLTGEEVVQGRIVGEVERQSRLAAWLQDNSEGKGISSDWDVKLL